MRRRFEDPNTTIGVVATNARLTREQAQKIAQMGQNGLARTIRPVHTLFDGDVVFVLAHPEVSADLHVIGLLAQTALEDASITGDPYLAGSADQMVVGTPMPTVVEMRCNWDSMKPEMQAVLNDTKTPEDAAPAMQEAAEACVATLE